MQQWMLNVLKSYMLRRQMVLRESSIDLNFKIAESEEELTEAFQLLHEHCVDWYGLKPKPSGLYLTKYHALPSTTVIIARWKDTIVGTATLVRDTPFGVPCCNQDQLRELRTQYPRLGELAFVAIRPEFRKGAKSIFFPFFKYIMTYAMNYMHLDGLLTCVRPESSLFYEGILCFDRLSQKAERQDLHFGKEAHILFMDLGKIQDKYLKAYGAKSSAQNLHEYLTKEEDHFYFPHRALPRTYDAVMNPKLIDFFFNQQTRIFTDLTDFEKGVLNAFYPFPSYRMVLPQTTSVTFLHHRHSPRFEVDCVGQCEADGVMKACRILDVSKNGLQIQMEENMPTPQKIQIQVSETQKVNVEVQPIWKSKDGVFGFKVMRADENWYRFIGGLRSDYEGRVLMAVAGK